MLAHPLKSQRGSAILENLIASAIITLGIATVSSALANQSRSAKELNDRFSRAELANSIFETIDCPETIHQACDNGQRRLYSTTGPLNFSLPYAVDANQGVTALEVSCFGGVVNAQIRLTGSKDANAPLFPGGICRRRFGGPKYCPSGKMVVSFDDEAGKLICGPLPEKR